jgi:biotin transport system substrate-specific component
VVSTIALTLAPPRSRASARVSYEVGCALVGSVLIAGLAQLSFHLPFTPVPVTGQTLGVLLVGAAYGPGLGVATLGLYLLWGVVGLPVFAPNATGAHDTGLVVLRAASLTGGYLWGFVLSAAVVGALSRRGWDRSVRGAIGAMFLGSIVIYAIGVPWLYHALPASIDGQPVTLETGLLPLAWRALDRFRPQDEGPRAPG